MTEEVVPTVPNAAGPGIDVLLQQYSVVKAMGDMVKEREARVKAHIADTKFFAPGDRKYVTVAGQRVATISVSEVKTTEEFFVEDEAALITYLEEEEQGDGVETVKRLTDWKSAEMIASAANIARTSGELLPGIGVREKTTGGSMSIRQTPTQRSALQDNANELRAVFHDVLSDSVNLAEIAAVPEPAAPVQVVTAKGKKKKKGSKKKQQHQKKAA